MGWCVVQLRWIRERHEATKGIGLTVGGGAAPWPIWLFGERGIEQIGVVSDYVDSQRSLEELQQLFPEAQIERITHARLREIATYMQMSRLRPALGHGLGMRPDLQGLDPRQMQDAPSR